MTENITGGANRNPIPAHRTFAHRSLFQNLYKDKIDLSNIPNDLKTMIMDQSTARLAQYEPSKYVTRSETKCSILDTKQMMALKKKRLESVFTEGFFSDPKELYRPIGEVTLDTKDLLNQSLQLEINQRESKETEAQKEAIQQKQQKFKMKMKFHQVPKRSDDGFSQIKAQLQKSNERIGSLRFGVPFSEVSNLDKREKTYDHSHSVSPESKSIDWNHLEFEEDRKLFFQGIYNKYLNTQKGQESPSSNTGGSNENSPVPEEGIRRNNNPAQLRLPKRGGGKPNTKAEVTEKPVFSSKQIEGALGIQKNHNTTETTDNYFNTRDDFYENRTRLNYRLAGDLERMDQIRRKTFEQKVKYFQISKKGQAYQGLKTMRKKAQMEVKSNAKHILDSHPWYNELINKVVILNGAKREVTQQETVILQELRRLIEDQSKFTKVVFYNLMRLLPTKDFLKDDVQRIIRFVKQHETITERDYIEAVELAGHALF